MLILSIVGFISSLISIITFFKNEKKSLKKWLYLGYFILISIITGLYITELSKNLKMKSIENQASLILEENDLSSDNKKIEYIIRCTAFLERYKEEYPDTYKLVSDYINKNNLLEKKTHKSYESADLSEACSVLRGYVLGVSILKENN